MPGTRSKPKGQNRGNNPISRRAVISFLTAQPGSTVDEIVQGTKLSRQTVSYAVDAIAEPILGSWPRRWRLQAGNEVIVTPGKPVPVEQTWGRWMAVTRNWPTAIQKLSEQDDPSLIAGGLESMAANAAALAVSFRSVQDEPDWRERIGVPS